MEMTRRPYTLTATAEILGLSGSSAYEAVRGGDIPSINVGYRIAIARSVVGRLIDRGSDDQLAPRTGARVGSEVDPEAVTSASLSHRSACRGGERSAPSVRVSFESADASAAGHQETGADPLQFTRAQGGTRTRTIPKDPRGLSPLRLPFRHPGLSPP